MIRREVNNWANKTEKDPRQSFKMKFKKNLLLNP